MKKQTNEQQIEKIEKWIAEQEKKGRERARNEERKIANTLDYVYITDDSSYYE